MNFKQLMKIVMIIMFVTFISAPSILQAVNIKSSKLNGLVYKEDFKDWRDDHTDPGFNTSLKVKGKKIRITTGNVAYGKAMSKLDPITINVTKKTEMIIDIHRISMDAVATIRVMNAYEPHDSYQVARIQKNLGIYKANLQEITGWEGVTSMWVEIWIEGSKKSLTVKSLYFQDNNVLKKRRKAQALHAYTEQDFAPAPENSIYFEDFRNGIGGWRTNESDPGFGSEMNFETGVPRMEMVTGKGYCKMLSELVGIRAEITSTTELEVSLGELSNCRIKIDVMTAHAPFDNHSVISWVDKSGVYKMNLAEQTKWKGSKVFWIQVWMETTVSTPGDIAAAIKYIRISDEPRVSKKN